jgi:hypothetical protein
MQRELMNQAMAMFDSAEKWNAFLDLSRLVGFKPPDNAEGIIGEYFKKVKKPLMAYFSNHIADGWACSPWQNDTMDVCWYLKQFGIGSLALKTGWFFEFHLRVEDTASFDSSRIDQDLKSETYSLIRCAFDADREFVDSQTKLVQTRYYDFDGCLYNGRFGWQHVPELAWYAGNRTDEFVDQIIAKVERFTNDKNLTALLCQLNDNAKKTPL